MVKVTGPCFSLDASGSIAGTVTFSKWKGRPYARQLVRPANPRSAGQTYNRAMFKFLSQSWAVFGPSAEQSSWQTQADELKVSPFNAYVRANMRDWQSFLPPIAISTTVRQAATTSQPTIAAAAAPARATITITDGGGTAAWGYVLYRKSGSAPSGVATEVIAIIPNDGAGATYIDSDLPAATYHYKAQPFQTDDLKGPISADCNAIVT
jgi:hypothetical protein